ncbi:immunoglobulin lambda-1 light chain-like [Ictalurus furcatus]|uniref:immunoglobulin lambda-1 light chain-like n=1 Tax=Ictalurus furcatus TaxID=66913 RepID=UPI0023505D4A|nr:immunoglobulin lambda-1 light chain-like [Ictalurus furcatus]
MADSNMKGMQYKSAKSMQMYCMFCVCERSWRCVFCESLLSHTVYKEQCVSVCSLSLLSKEARVSFLSFFTDLNMMLLNTVSLTAILLTLSGLKALVLTQEKVISVQAGQNVKILCSPSTSSWAITWYQQKPGKAPTFLLYDSIRASGLPSRFTYSESGSQEYLHINGVEAEDEAVYYCACPSCVVTGTVGGGTEVSFAISSPPSLVLLAPSQSLSSGDEVRVVCLAQGFRPDSATLSWSDNGDAVAGAEVQTSSSERQSDGTFIQSSMLKLSPERWSSGRTYTCHLNHPALSAPLSQSASAEKCS